MIERRGNIWTAPPLGAWRVIPLGGTTWDQACQRHPDLAGLLGHPKRAKLVSSRCYQFSGSDRTLKVITIPIPRATFPAEPSIVRLELLLEDLATFLDPKDFYVLPRLGCGEDGFDWISQVRPLLMRFPDNVIVVSR